jgi:hypothetical protein
VSLLFAINLSFRGRVGFSFRSAALSLRLPNPPVDLGLEHADQSGVCLEAEANSWRW